MALNHYFKNSDICIGISNIDLVKLRGQLERIFIQDFVIYIFRLKSSIKKLKCEIEDFIDQIKWKKRKSMMFKSNGYNIRKAII